MNDEILDLVDDVAHRVQRAITSRDCPAIVAVDGRRKLVLSDYDYLRDRATAQAFERRAAEAAHTVHAVRWVFAVPMIWFESSAGISARAVSNDPLNEGEQESILWIAFDQADGIDYGRVPYTRRPNGEPIFGDTEIVTLNVSLDDQAPGRTLLRHFLEGDDHPAA
ncbi:hypothetical protein LO772_27380 [Yinghuangia sp. ASG 101]|uniref:hypothetical protein n=1 Tax=Yinghuangia sp. ASG 101 TaxID=2896848 RepID=UPI001E556A68|nr:hypothetical protein [Yinghuangia sp. ASG 101]UGQ10537.1 hypothetical protein LO772_27380 [Yinghuangia sp. ASG 101]